MPAEHVLLLHGLCRSTRSLMRMSAALSDAGFVPHCISYPSRSASIEQLADSALPPAVRRCEEAGAGAIHFVTHSMGGILVRSYLRRHPHPPLLGRVVMLAPPNHGSEIVDRLRHWRLFQQINGAAGQELGTGADSTPQRLGAADFETGILAGRRSLDWFFSAFFFSGPNDGKVSVESTRLEGMRDHRVLPATHTFITRNAAAIRQTIHFLRHGRFV
ncbi:MAG: alpha/beta fold hydrolase [Puniceicoccales bacterium]|nr:alpha/beta fold hydrolase [Puniceicoccales bacterium]